ncbi:MAG: S8 family serine peptidase, partial [Verrucomicrobiota bacterium]|nr:S8 family serine peptidase [Verrucomicrobiota bacterium]
MRTPCTASYWRRWRILAAVVTLAVFFFNAHAKQIRLRNETIDTEAPSGKATALMSSTAPVSGLYLVQLSEPLRPEWKAQLRNLNVELLRFVPEDAYIAFFNSASIQKLRGTGFVRWIGQYKPEHRLDPRLTRALRTASPKTNLTVKLLLSPLASPSEARRLARSLAGSQRPSTYPFGSTITGTATPAQLDALTRSPLVLWIEPAPQMRLLDEISTKIVCGDDFESGTPAIAHQLGFNGSGVIVAVPDSGLDTGEAGNLHPDIAGRVDALFAYGGLLDASDEHGHGTHVAGIIAGNAATGEQDELGFFYGLGVAPGAHLVIQRIFDAVGEYYPPDTFAQLTQDAVRNGAVIGSNSWGDDTQGQYDISAAEFDALVRDADADTPGAQPFILEFSAGNSGPARQTIGSPAVAKNVIATGACQNSRPEFFIYGDGPEVTADFSSRGPCEDGRIKPDLMAPGTWIASLKSSYASDEFAWAPIDAYYMFQVGTSQAGPHVSGAAAIFVQFYRQTHGGVTPSPALVKAALINSADDMGFGYLVDEEGNVEVVGDTDPVPNRDEGWGRVNVENLIAGDLRFVFVEQGPRLTTGQTWERQVVVGPNAPLKITMVYTDVPGLPAAIPALVNDLDLEVIGPDGALYRGNVFLNGESIPNAGAPDNINNVEGVHLGNPKPGDYLVRIRARNVAEDINGRRGSVPEQDFALVISGDLPEPGEGIVFFDRPAYTAPANAVIRLIDQQLAGSSAATVRVTSTSEPVGETIVLLPAGNGGAFTNSVPLMQGVFVHGDGRIGVRHGDTLRVVYSDANPPGERTSE